MVIGTFLTLLLGVTTLAQATPPPMPAAAPAPAADTLNNGACMDSPRAVPRALMEPAVRSMEIVRIDKVNSTQTMLSNETIGFLYTLADGTTWLGQRSQDYMSAADARAVNQVLASTHMPNAPVTSFPPATKLGVATKYQQYFRVQIPSAAFQGLNIALEPCVVWPAGRPLPDPTL